MNFKPPSYFMEAMRPVVSQIEMKRKLAFAFSHYTLFLDDPTVGRATPLVYGPSGSGKTFAIEICAEASGLPYTFIGSAEISAAGYKGITLRDLLAQHYLLYRESEGIIFLDEIDKWARVGMGSSDGEQVALGQGKMAEMLRYIERQDVHFQDEGKDMAGLRMHDEEHDDLVGEDEAAWVPIKFETRKAMWVLAGAFNRLEHIVKARLMQETLMDEAQLWEKASPEDFVRYGMLQELVNRTDVHVWVKPLKGHEIIEILQQQERPRLEKLFQAIGCRLDLDDGALAYTAQLAVQEKTGARGAVLRLRHVVSDCYTEADEAGLSRCLIDAHVLLSGHLDLSYGVAV
jgi:ATP-dependent Clp protease ATP-binding subunit ClpX